MGQVMPYVVALGLMITAILEIGIGAIGLTMVFGSTNHLIFI
jgi:hypothetical protein